VVHQEPGFTFEKHGEEGDLVAEEDPRSAKHFNAINGRNFWARA
jgi:hypothetical protein